MASAAGAAVANTTGIITARRVTPPDYERELATRKDDLSKEKHLNLLLFPEQDVTVENKGWKYRTEKCPVTEGDLQLPTQLFTKDCLEFYSSPWARVLYDYSKYGGTYSSLLDEEERETLPPLTFERDQIEKERLFQEAIDSSLKTVSKSGYLLKGLFPNESGFGHSVKNYRKRWFELKGGPAYGGYTLVYYRDDKSTSVKGKIYLETCTDIRPNTKYRTYGFDLLTEDEKVFYPLATETQKEMEEWLVMLGKALGLMEDDEQVNPSKYRAVYSQDTLRDTSKKTLHRPELLQYNSERAAQNRQADRNNLFILYPEYLYQSSVDETVIPSPPKEELGFQIHVTCQDLSLKLTLSRHGKRELLEPFHVTLALFDAQKFLKISEDFHIDFTNPEALGYSSVDDDDEIKRVRDTNQAVFSVTFPHPEVYLVARIEKVLQGTISSCVEPYMKPGDSLKVIDKLSKHVSSVYERLRDYRMPFAWAAKPLFAGGNEINELTDLGPLYRQERERLTDNDVLKILVDYKNIGKHRLQSIPGSLNVSVQPYTASGNCLTFTPSYLPVKSTSPPLSSKAEVCLEVKEFAPLEAYETFSRCGPNLSLTNHFYVYPLALKYDTQKQFSKARNIAVCIQLRDNDGSDSKPLKAIYNNQSGELLTDTTSAAVLYHCTTPTFYEEVKICLPTRISRRHHLLFIFKHISCDIPKAPRGAHGSLKQKSLETIVGYSWLPILSSDGRIASGIQQLPVAAMLLPGYLAALRPELKKRDIPDIKWVTDSSKPLFTIRAFSDTSIYTEVTEIFNFFAICDHIISGRQVPLEDLKFAIESLQDIEVESLKSLPILLNRMFKLMCQSFDRVEDVKFNMFKVLVGIVKEVGLLGRQDILKSYIEYAFSTSIDDITGKSVHDELVTLLLEYIDKEKDQGNILINNVWFFLDIILKSIAQCLHQMKKDKDTNRKNRIPSELGNNIQTLLTHLVSQICLDTTDGQKANISVAQFVKQSFSCLDRGVVFKFIESCIDQFDSLDRQFVAELRLDFLSKICEHEHFIPLNLPFETNALVTPYYLTDEYCTSHYLSGLLLRELESALKSTNGPVRVKAIEIVRDLLAKLDLDDRYSEQRSRIASLFFPLITLVIEHSTKLYRDTKEYSRQHISETDQMSEVSATTPPPVVTGGPDESLLSKKSFASDLSSISSSDVPVLTKKSSILSMATPPPSKPSVIEAINPLDISSTATPPLTPGSVSDSAAAADHEQLEKSENDKLMTATAAVAVEMFSYKETRDLLMCFLFVLKDASQDILFHWWQQCIDASTPLTRTFSLSNRLDDSTTSGGVQNEPIELMAFFDVLECCTKVFEYEGRLTITKKWSARTSLLKQLEMMYKPSDSLLALSSGARKSHVISRSLLSAAASGGGGSRARFSQAYSSSSIRSSVSDVFPSFSTQQQQQQQGIGGEDDMEVIIKVEGGLANEVGLTLLNTLEIFGDKFQDQLNDDEDYVQLTRKFFSLLVKLLEVNPSTNLQAHIFASLKGITQKFAKVLFEGSPEYCGALCYQLLRCCNSNIAQTRAQAIALLYMMMKINFQEQKSFTRTGLQITIALSKIATSYITWSQSHLRRSLAGIVVYADNDPKVKSTSFPREIRELMIRLRTVLSSTAQMKEHRKDPEKLLDLYYSLAKSYAHSPELRHTWLESMADRHVLNSNHNEAAQCYLHIAGLIAENLRLAGKYPEGCSILANLSCNIELEEGDIEQDEAVTMEQRYTERDLVENLEQALTQLEKAQLYELMTPVFKILLPYYEADKDFKKLMEVYGRLYEAHKRIVSIMQTGQRYLGTYFRVAFFGILFGEDDFKVFIYREPKVTSLAEITQRLGKLYSKLGAVQMIHDSGKVDISKLDPEKAYIQVTHVTPFFSEEDLTERGTQFERENEINRFVFETPFTESGKAHGSVATQWMRKTVLKTSHWFPYIVKRIPVIGTEEFEISPIQVAIEAMEKKGMDLARELEREQSDLVKLQLLLQGSISAQVNQGVQEYANVFLKPPLKYERKFTDHLKEIYRVFIELCERALQLHGQLISKEQQLLQMEMMNKFQMMLRQLMPLLDKGNKRRLTSTRTDAMFSLPRMKPEQLTRAMTASVISTPTTI